MSEVPFLDLTDEGDDFEFPYPPSAIWLIFSLEFPVLYRDRKFILVTQPYYGDHASPMNYGEGILYPPFSAFPVDFRFFAPRTLGDARKLLDQVEQEKFNREFIDGMAYNLGLGEPKYERINARPIDEFKISPRGHNTFKLFRIVRFRCWHSASFGKRNLTDPESLKGLYYVPLDLPQVAVPNVRYGPHRYRFNSKMVASHFNRIVGTYAGERSRDKYTVISEGDILSDEQGWIVFLDISGFGRAEAATREKGFHPSETSIEIARSLRRHISELFAALFQSMNVLQYVTMGDGFIAAVPFRAIDDDVQFFRSLHEATMKFGREIDRLNGLLRPSGETLGVRLCILRGDYCYGKVGGLSALRADFDGTILIDGARLDAATKEQLSADERKGTLVVAAYDVDFLTSFDPLPFELRTFSMQVKEASVKGAFRLYPLDKP